MYVLEGTYMIGWIIAAAAVVLAHKAQASGTPTPSTQVTVGPVPTFGNVTPQSSLAPSREPVHMGVDTWQKGPLVPVPVGSRPDIFSSVNPGAISDSVSNQIIQLGQFVSGAANVQNPNRPPATAAAGGTGGGASVPGSVAPPPPGGGTNLGGSGGFGGRARIFLQ